MTTSNPFTTRVAQAAQDGYLPAKPAKPGYAGLRKTNGPVVPFDINIQEDMVSTPQLDLLDTLWAERDLSTETRPAYAARLAELETRGERGGLTRAKASALITYLKELPLLPTPEARIPAGLYAVEINGLLTFVQVDRPDSGKWAGFTFVKRQNGPNMDRMGRDHQRLALAAIAQAGPREASIRYGLELGICGVCNTALTNAESRAYGMGPVCRKKDVW